jgi:hypothetical protein
MLFVANSNLHFAYIVQRGLPTVSIASIFELRGGVCPAATPLSAPPGLTICFAGAWENRDDKDIAARNLWAFVAPNQSWLDGSNDACFHSAEEL